LRDEPEEILDAVAEAGSWLPVTVARRAFTNRDVLVPILLEAVESRSVAGRSLLFFINPSRYLNSR